MNIHRINWIPFSRDFIQLRKKVLDQAYGELVTSYRDYIPADTKFDRFELFDEFDIPVMFAEETAKDIVIRENDLFNNH